MYTGFESNGGFFFFFFKEGSKGTLEYSYI